jgi:hypothetical protein
MPAEQAACTGFSGSRAPNSAALNLVEQEPWYFYGLERAGYIPPRRVRLEVLSDGTRSAPEHVAARLGAWEAEHRLIASDERWLVVDVDRHHNLHTTLAEAVRITTAPRC